MDLILSEYTSVKDGLAQMLTYYIGKHDLIHTWVEIDKALFIVEVAKRAEDREKWFPHGKWATIQTIQGRIENVFEDLCLGKE